MKMIFAELDRMSAGGQLGKGKVFESVVRRIEVVFRQTTVRNLFAVSLVPVILCVSADVVAQTHDEMAAVMPSADRFEEGEADPPIKTAYLEDRLIGYVFRTADWPPERLGYSGPIQALVGLDLNGHITGVQVLEYYESHRSLLGDFLRRDGVQEQFLGKHIADPFVVRQDIDGVTRATVSMRAFARGVRDAARRVAEVYLNAAEAIEGPVEDTANLSWFDLLRTGVVARMEVSDESGTAEIALSHIMNDAFGERFIGLGAMGMIGRAVDRREGGGHVFVYAVDGPSLQYFNRTGWSIVQESDTVVVEESDVFSFGLASEGMLDVEVGTAGAILVDRRIDLERPFRFVFSLDSSLSPFGIEYRTLAARNVASAVTVASATDAPLGTGADSGTVGGRELPDSAAGAVVVDAPFVAAPSPSGTLDPLALTIVDEVEEQSQLARALAGTSWHRVGTTLLVLLLATLAFWLKSSALNWVALSVTLVFVGFVDGGFLSVSHITSGIWTGVSGYTGDVSLLLMIVFAVFSTLLFGRVFCGFLCPFGALQEFLAKLVPRRFQIRVPWPVHARGVYVKYGILAVILIPALLGNRTSIYQYFEPFGTVFFHSRSPLLWSIAGAVIIASAFIPRFYCRYACPLGAALAIGSLISLKRIGRVKQCDHCGVCEQACPTAAIQGPTIDFKECVRCNICEIKLKEKAGVCRHDIGEVESRLVQITKSTPV